MLLAQDLHCKAVFLAQDKVKDAKHLFFQIILSNHNLLLSIRHRIYYMCFEIRLCVNILYQNEQLYTSFSIVYIIQGYNNHVNSNLQAV